MATATETRKPIAVGTCSNCGYTYKTTLPRDTSARKIVTCPECGDGRIIARKLKRQEASSGASSGSEQATEPNKETEGEGKKGGEQKAGSEETGKEKPSSEETTEPAAKARKKSTVRKVKHERTNPPATKVRRSDGRSGSKKPAPGRKTAGEKPAKSTARGRGKAKPTEPPAVDREDYSEASTEHDYRWSEERIFPGVY